MGLPTMPGGPSMPGGSTGGGGTGRKVGAMPRLTFMDWDVVTIGKLHVVTGGEGAKEEPLTPEQHVLKALHFDKAAKAKDERPTLVYFHWPHEHAKNGDLTTRLCEKVLNEEHVARWGQLFRCVQVDMGTSETKFTEMVGSKSTPAFVVLDAKGKVVVNIKPAKSSSKLRKAFEAAIAKFPKAAKKLKKDLAQQAKNMKDAKKLEKQDKLKEALELIDEVRFSDLRVGPEFEKAQAWGQTLALKINSKKK